MDSSPARTSDVVLERLMAEAMEDPDTVGLILGGSRGAGYNWPDSDYDVHWVLRDEAFVTRQDQGEPSRDKLVVEGHPPAELLYTSVRELRRIAADPGWWTPGYATARVLLDKTGEVASALRAIATMPDDRARADAAAWYDAYLNAFHRSLKAWRRGDELGARLLAAESAMHLVRTLFSLEQQWPPYSDRLKPRLESLHNQGWMPGELREALLGVMRTGDPHLQLRLDARVEALMRARGFGPVLDGWGDTIELVKARYAMDA